jgi:hypothetical protein
MSWWKARETPISKPVSIGLRVVLSVFIVYHLLVISVMPNRSSFLGRQLEPWINPYANLLGLNITWNFFAPDPEHTMYIHYRVYFPENEGGESRDPVEGFIPPAKEKIVVDTSARRFFYAMRFLILDQRRMKVLLVPFLCRSHEGAEEVHIKSILEPIPSLDLSRIGEMLEKTEKTLLEYRQSCHSTEQDEVSL